MYSNSGIYWFTCNYYQKYIIVYYAFLLLLNFCHFLKGNSSVSNSFFPSLISTPPFNYCCHVATQTCIVFIGCEIDFNYFCWSINVLQLSRGASVCLSDTIRVGTYIVFLVFKSTSSTIRQGYILTNLINMSVKLFSTVSIVFFPVDFKYARYHSRFCIFN